MSGTSADQAHNMPPPTRILSFPYVGCFSLFYPPPIARHDSFNNRCQAEAQYRLQKAQAFYSASASILSAADLRAAFPDVPTQTLLLITGTATRSSDYVLEVITFGAYFPRHGACSENGSTRRANRLLRSRSLLVPARATAGDLTL